MENRRGLRALVAFWLAAALLVLTAGNAMPRPAFADSTGGRLPSTGNNAEGPGDADWTNAGYITADDTSYASAAIPSQSGIDSSEYIQGTGYGFSIPDDATINGITVSVMRRASYNNAFGTITDQDLRLLKGGDLVGTNHATSSNWPESMTVATYGSSSDLWGSTWTPAQINDPGFGASLSAYNTSWYYIRTAYVDYISIAVAYTPSSLTVTTGSLQNGSIGVAYSQTLAASGGTPGYAWSIDSGSLPEGLSLNASGAITGTPSAAGGPTSVGFCVTDAANASATRMLSITINNSTPTIAWENPADIVYGITLSDTQLCATASVPGTFAYTPGIGALLDAGNSQVLHVDFAPDDSINYAPAFRDVMIDVLPRAITVTAGPKSKIYAAADPALSYSYAPALIGNDTFDGALSRAAGESAGSYAIGQGTLCLNANYSITWVSAAFTILPRSLTITANDRGKTLGDTVVFAGSEFTAAGLMEPDAVDSVSLNSDGAGASAPIGQYDILPSGAMGTGLSNYSIIYVNGTLTVSTLALTITAADRSKVYGENLAFSGTEFSVIGLEEGDSVSSVALASAGAAASAQAGEWSIVPSNAVGTGLDKYTITYDNGILTVNPAELTITASNLTKTLGETLVFAGNEFTATGLAAWDNVTYINLNSAGAGAAAPLGTYEIVPGDAAGIGLANYRISYVSGALSVRKGLTITANSLVKVYGDAVTFSGTEFTVSGLSGADSVISVTLTSQGAGAEAAVGTWDIVPGSAVGTGLENYDISYSNGAITISPRRLSIIANDSSKDSGSTATLVGTEFRAEGLVNGDRVRLITLTSAGTEASAAGGAYDIVPSNALGEGLSNYSITYVNGKLTVNRTAVLWSVVTSPAHTDEGNTVTLTATVKPNVVWSLTPPSVSSVSTEEPFDYGIELTPSGAIGTILLNYGGINMTATLTYVKPTGTVTFMDGGNVIGTAELINGTATLTVSHMSVGSHYITALYNGDGNFEHGTTLAHIHTVEPGPGLDWWLISGITGGVLGGVALLAMAAVLIRRRRKPVPDAVAP